MVLRCVNKAFVFKQVQPRLYLKDVESICLSEPIASTVEATAFAMAYFEDLDRENLICVNFDNGMHAINFHVVATGDHTGAQTNISNIFKTAILSNATGFILFHNHPSGQIKPSKQDIHLTQAVAKAADFMGIQLIDHIICAPQGNFYSFKEENLL